MTTYDVTIEIDQDIPEDVLMEHIGAALKQYRAEAVPARSPRVTVRKLHDLTEPVEYANGGTVTGPPVAFTKEQIRALAGANLNYIDELARRANGRAHPFDGPEMFDDIEHAHQGEGKPLRYPKLDELLEAKSGEGDWDLEEGDEVGND